METKKIIISFSLTALLVLYLSVSKPEGIVVNEHGDIEGITNQIRESLQGTAFWQHQAQVIRARLDRELSAPNRRAELKSKMAATLSEHERFMEKMYQKYPESRPSPAELHAEALRKKADEIEQEELNLITEELRLKKISSLRKVLLVVEGKQINAH